jgi:hypothetical protein
MTENNKPDVTDPDDEVADAEVVAPGAELVAISGSAEVVTYLASQQAIEEESAEQTAFEIVASILNATTLEEVLKRTAVISSEDATGRPLVVTGVKWHRSDFEAAEGVYGLVYAEDAFTGEELLVTAGGRTVMAQLYRLGQLGAFPARMQFGRASRATRSGYFPMWLEPAPEAPTV